MSSEPEADPNAGIDGTLRTAPPVNEMVEAPAAFSPELATV
jgi:hypothetical protein